ncbi:hypothetical protein GWI33_004268 [Rhynchophorus ferrugineus]|uniref:Uncharacterized protein n=1 Tax=Rhynchophorus ferrugineus TaxID=354439 RepID=A0A834MET6_RHYFE|nr:hypothetical protein GWI33_004268 [Rhynchophorus ferrugineus]
MLKKTHLPARSETVRASGTRAFPRAPRPNFYEPDRHPALGMSTTMTSGHLEPLECIIFAVGHPLTPAFSVRHEKHGRKW